MEKVAAEEAERIGALDVEDGSVCRADDKVRMLEFLALVLLSLCFLFSCDPQWCLVFLRRNSNSWISSSTLGLGFLFRWPILIPATVSSLCLSLYLSLFDLFLSQLKFRVFGDSGDWSASWRESPIRGTFSVILCQNYHEKLFSQVTSSLNKNNWLRFYKVVNLRFFTVSDDGK